VSSVSKILLVGDDPVERASFEKVLAGKGYAVVTASSGEEALWQLSIGKCDAVFTNMTLRGMSGLEVAEEIHASQPWLPVVIITSYGSDDAQSRAAAVGVTTFLPQPVSSGQLAETAERVLQAAQSVSALRPQTAAAEARPPQAMIGFALRLRDVVLFLLAPFIGLAYLFAFPIVGLGTLAWLAFKAKEPVTEEAEPLHPAASAGPGVLKTIAMMLAVVISGVVYAVVGPILGIGLILWASFEAWGKLGAKALRA